MATLKEKRNAAYEKASSRPSRPSLAKMNEIRSANNINRPATSKAKRNATPKMVGKTPRGEKPSVAKPKSVPTGRPSAAKSKPKKPNYRSGKGRAARVLIPGRHVPDSLRYKTGHWRPVRQKWMSDEVWEAYKAINRFRTKTMDKALRKASLGQKIFGKRGPGHKGFGTGYLQKWADRAVKRGEDPHMVDLAKWFAGAVAAIDYHTGGKDFDQLMRLQKKDENHFMRYVIQKMQDYIPQVKKLTKKGMTELMRHQYYTAQYGPDGRAK